MLNLLPTLLSEFHEKFQTLNNTVPRECQFPAIEGKIKVAIGMRRVGKTYFLFQTIRELLNQAQVPMRQILYLNFEDDRLLPCTKETLRELLEAFYQLYPENHDKLCYFFLDEIQNVQDWALVIRRFFDSKKLHIYLSGSSAKLLSKEIASSLRGRSIALEIWPFSFKEYLTAQQVKIDLTLYTEKTKDILFDKFKNYIQLGGFPEVQHLAISDTRHLLQDYIELVVLKDIVERYSVTNISLLRYLIKTLLKNTAAGFSITKFSKDIKSQGLMGSKNTISDYLKYIEDCFLAFSVPLYSESIRKVESNPKKIYGIDTGLIHAFSFSFSKNYGHLFENIFFLDLKRSHHKIYYYLTQERYEVDFLVEDSVGNKKLYQVVWDISNQQTLEREIRALEKAQNELGIPGELITPEKYLKSTWEMML